MLQDEVLFFNINLLDSLYDRTISLNISSCIHKLVYSQRNIWQKVYYYEVTKALIILFLTFSASTWLAKSYLLLNLRYYDCFRCLIYMVQCVSSISLSLYLYISFSTQTANESINQRAVYSIKYLIGCCSVFYCSNRFRR